MLQQHESKSKSEWYKSKSKSEWYESKSKSEWYESKSKSEWYKLHISVKACFCQSMFISGKSLSKSCCSNQ